MAQVLVAGGGICGTAAALMLARDGHDVVVIDRDPAPLPASAEAAWEWERRSVAQFRFAHLMLARGHQVLTTELPNVPARLLAEGGLHLNLLDLMIDSIEGAERRPDDDRFDAVTGRRSTVEWVLASTLAETGDVTVRRGAAIEGLLAGREVLPGVPHVGGVRLADGEELRADLVIDATGRRSSSPDWIAAMGGRAPWEESEDSGFTYVGRFFRSSDGSVPELRAPVLSPIGSISVLCIPSDNGTWSITLYAAASDAPMRRLRDPAVFERVVRACPAHAHWLDGEPIGEVASMSGVLDRTRHFVVDGAPVVTGMLTIADANACTNPSLGRGMSLGLTQAALMRAAVRSHLASPADLALAFDADTTATIGPWRDATRAADRARAAEMSALADGRAPDPDPGTAIAGTIQAAMTRDEQALRWVAEIQGCLSVPLAVFSRPGAIEHLRELQARFEPLVLPGPDRDQLLELVS